MSDLLSNELLLMQQSRCSMKYLDIKEDLQELPSRLNRNICQPMDKYSRRISALVKNRGRMLYILDKRVSRFLKKYNL